MRMESRCRSRILEYLTIVSTKEGVEGVVAVILDHRLVLILKARQKLVASIQQSFGFSTVNYCRKTTPD